MRHAPRAQMGAPRSATAVDRPDRSPSRAAGADGTKEVADQATNDAQGARRSARRRAPTSPAYEADAARRRRRRAERGPAATTSSASTPRSSRGTAATTTPTTPTVACERQVGGNWATFADQTGEIPVTLKYPLGPTDVATLPRGGQDWKWTAHFEAFVSALRRWRPAGHDSRRPPARTASSSTAQRRKGGARSCRTTLESNTFEVKPWNGITVERRARRPRRAT